MVALPADVFSKKSMTPPFPLLMVALPAVELVLKVVKLPLAVVILALPAEVLSARERLALLKMVELPRVELLKALS